MTNADLQFLTVDQWVHRFADIGVQQDKAEQAEHDSKYKRLFFEMSDIQEELKRRSGDQRRALVTLLDYPNMQVRLRAAQYALAVAPEAARQTIEAIAASTWPPQCYDARNCLRRLDEGEFVPD